MRSPGNSLLLIAALLFLNLTTASAWQKIRYPVDAIPAGLTENAGVVIRLNEQQVTVTSPGSMSIKCREARTILRESGLPASLLQIGYNSLIRVGSLSGSIYDKSGNRVRNIKSDDILDISSFDGFSIYSDARVKVVDPGHFNYPFTVEYEYELTFRSALYLPSFYIFGGPEVSVERAAYSLTTPQGYVVRYLEQNGMPPCTVSEAGNVRTYQWQFEGFRAPRSEPYAASPVDQYPHVLISPGEYSIENYSGRMDSWESFSSFCYGLLEGKQVLPETTSANVRSMIAGMESDRDKVSAIYRYSQAKNRYVSIQKGIGGIVPFDASTVDRFSYGDCKALANYVMSLLQVAGIRAYYTLVYAGDKPRPVCPDLVNDYFNHVILCVPLGTDTIWLECTNPYAPPNHLGSFTDDRYVLLVSDTGGRLVRTPSYTHSENSAVVSSQVKIESGGNVNVAQKGIYRGTFYDGEHSLLLMDEKDRQKALLRTIPLPDISIGSFGISPCAGDSGAISKEIEFTAANSVVRSGNLMMFSQGLVTGTQEFPPVARSRESQVAIQRNYTRIDTITYILPAGYRTESVPAGIKLANEMAVCSYEVHQTDERVMIIRQFRMNKGLYPAVRFNDLRDLLEAIARKDEERIVLSKSLQ